MTSHDNDRNEKVAKTAAKLQSEGHKVQVLGRIKDGKIEIDQAGLAELASKFPNAEMAFVALNSPFDPVPCIVE